MGEHSRFSPSKAHIWGNCPGCVPITAGRKHTTNAAADEGTAAHWVTEQYVHGISTSVGVPAPNNIPVTNEMLQGAKLFRDEISARSQGAIYTECKLSIPSIHEDCFGTLDAFTVSNDTLYIWDYKFGWNPVDVHGNLQLIAYASGALVYAPRIKHISIGLIQPRAYHKDGPVRSYIVPIEEFNTIIEKLRNAAENATSKSPRLNTGQHCRYCDGKLMCPAYNKLTRDIMDEFSVDYSVEAPTIDMIGRELVDLLAMEDIIKRRISAANAELTTQLQNGGVCNTWVLNTSVGRWMWVDNAPFTEIEAITGVTISKTTHITPKQAVKEGIAWDHIKPYVYKSAGVKLVPAENIDGVKLFGGTNDGRK